MWIWLLSSLGLIGGLIIISGYLPQIVRLLKIKNSRGVSILAWSFFLLGNLMLLVYAISTKDFVYIALEVLSCLAITLIIFLTYIYRQKKF